MLGPGMNIARTPYNGRNFEYFGEDPYLAASTAVAVIKGIQSHPVLADAKHFAFNNQETDRMTIDARVDERTGARSTCAAFGRGEEGRRRLGHVLVQQGRRHVRVREPRPAHRLPAPRLGLRRLRGVRLGAVHSTAPSARAGLDLEMHAFAAGVPATPVTGSAGRYFGADQLRAAMAGGALSEARIDDMVRNIVRPMFEHGLFDDPVAPGAAPFLSWMSPHPSTSRSPSATARRDGDAEEPRPHLLPLDAVDGGRTIVVIGWAANPVGAANAVSGGGSSHGSGLLPRVVSPLGTSPPPRNSTATGSCTSRGPASRTPGQRPRSPDVVVVVATDGSDAGSDRPDLGLRPMACVTVFCQAIPVEQEDMIAAAT